MTFLKDVSVFTQEYRREIDEITKGTWYPILLIIKITGENECSTEVKTKSKTAEDETIYTEHILQLDDRWNPSPCILVAKTPIIKDTTVVLRYITSTRFNSKRIDLKSATAQNSVFYIDSDIRYFLPDVQIIGGNEGDVLEVLALGDTNTRAIHATNWKELFDTSFDVHESVFVSFRLCPMCEGNSWYGNIKTECPMCFGSGITRIPSGKKWGLDLIGTDYGVYRLPSERLQNILDKTEIERRDISYRNRIHAQKWYMVQRIEDIKIFAGYYMDIDPSYVNIYEHGTVLTTDTIDSPYINILIGETLRNSFTLEDTLVIKDLKIETLEINKTNFDTIGLKTTTSRYPNFLTYWNIAATSPYADPIARAEYSTIITPYSVRLSGINGETASSWTITGIDLRHCPEIEFDTLLNMFGYTQDPADPTNVVPRLELHINGVLVNTITRQTGGVNRKITIPRSSFEPLVLENSEIMFRLVSGYMYDNVYIYNLNPKGYCQGVATLASLINTEIIEGKDMRIDSNYYGNMFLSFRFGDNIDQLEAAAWSDYTETPFTTTVTADLMQVRALLIPFSDQAEKLELLKGYIENISFYSYITTEREALYSPHVTVSIPFFNGNRSLWTYANEFEWNEWLDSITPAGIIMNMETYIPCGNNEDEPDYNEDCNDLLYTYDYVNLNEEE